MRVYFYLAGVYILSSDIVRPQFNWSGSSNGGNSGAAECTHVLFTDCDRTARALTSAHKLCNTIV